MTAAEPMTAPALVDSPATAPATPPPHGEIELTIVMPCLNEARTVGVCVRKAVASLRANGVAGEVIVADNGSTDGSREIAAAEGARVVPVPVRGYGAALWAGINAARGRYVMMADSDDSYDVANIMPFLEKLRAGYQFVMGNRFRGGIEPGAMPPLHQYFGNPFLTKLGRIFFRSDCGDFYCGQRAFDRRAVVAMDLQSTGMEFALEMLVKATMTGLRVTEVPMKLKPDGRGRAPHLRSWRDGWRSLRFYLLFSPKWLFLYPGLLMTAVGLAAFLWLLPAPRYVAGLRFDIHTMLYCAAVVVIGVQLVTFAVCGKMLAIVTGLHPRRPSLERMFARAHLELGLAAGAALVLLGGGLTVYSLAQWGSVNWRELNPFETMRSVIPATLSMTLGFQVMFASFFFSLLQVQCRKFQGITAAANAGGATAQA